jgi:hypothetical protein
MIAAGIRPAAMQLPVRCSIIAGAGSAAMRFVNLAQEHRA